MRWSVWPRFRFCWGRTGEREREAAWLLVACGDLQGTVQGEKEQDQGREGRNAWQGMGGHRGTGGVEAMKCARVKSFRVVVGCFAPFTIAVGFFCWASMLIELPTKGGRCGGRRRQESQVTRTSTAWVRYKIIAPLIMCQEVSFLPTSFHIWAKVLRRVATTYLPYLTYASTLPQVAFPNPMRGRTEGNTEAGTCSWSWKYLNWKLFLPIRHTEYH